MAIAPHFSNGLISSGYVPAAIGYSQGSSTEARVQIPYLAGTITKLYVNAYSGSGSASIRLRKNGANGNNYVSFSSSGEHYDASNSDTINDGDLINFYYSGSYSLSGPCFLFDSTSDMVSQLVVGNQGLSSIGNAVYFALSGRYYPIGIYGYIQPLPTSLTLKNLAAYITTGNSSGISYIKVYNQNTPSGLSLIIPANTTGLIKNTVNTADSGSASYYSSIALGSITFSFVSVSLTSTSKQFVSFSSYQKAYGASTTYKESVAGSLVGYTGTESNIALKVQKNVSIKNLYTYCSTFNSYPATIKLRIDGADGNLSLYIYSSGFFSAGGTDILSSDSKLSYTVETSNNGLTLNYIVLRGENKVYDTSLDLSQTSETNFISAYKGDLDISNYSTTVFSGLSSVSFDDLFFNYPEFSGEIDSVSGLIDYESTAEFLWQASLSSIILSNTSEVNLELSSVDVNIAHQQDFNSLLSFLPTLNIPSSPVVINTVGLDGITMKYRREDSNDDYCFGRGSGDFLQGTQAVAQAIKTKLKLFEGEWWENILDGLPLFQSILGQRTPKQQIAYLIKKRILEVPNILEIKDVAFVYNSTTREYLFSCSVSTVFSQNIVVQMPLQTQGA